MAFKVLNTFLGGLVVALLAFVSVYVIGYLLGGMFSPAGIGSATARAAGAGLGGAAAIAVFALYLRARSSGAPAMAERPEQKRAA